MFFADQQFFHTDQLFFFTVTKKLQKTNFWRLFFAKIRSSMSKDEEEQFA